MATRINAISGLDALLERSDAFIARMQAIGTAPDNRKVLRRLYSPGEAAELVGRDRTTLARAEAELDVPAPARHPQTGRRLGYSLEQIQAFRAHFGTLPWRNPETDPPLVLAIQNFKGGTGKSTTTINLSHYLGLQGYRVLLVDTDSQATTTSFFGYVPDRDLTKEDTLFSYLVGDQSDLKYAIRKTHWPTIDLIPSCLSLFDVDVGGIQYLAEQDTHAAKAEFFRELRYGIDTVSEQYDVVLIDTPPALAVMSLMVLMAADALIVPTTAKMADFASTVQFMRMIKNYIAQIDPNKEYEWIHVLITQFSRRGKTSKDDKTLQESFVDAMKEVFGEAKFRHVVHESLEVQQAAATFSTPYEAEKPHRRVLSQLGNVFAEIEVAIQRCWPSKIEALTERGIV